jgi:uncharacterized protein YjbI with pentapeptide repeats
VKSPRNVAELKFAAELHAFPDDDALETEGDYDRMLFDGRSFDDESGAARDARFAECAFTSTGLDGAVLRRARLTDVWFGETRLVAVDAAQSSFTDAWFSGCVFAGVQAFGCVGRRVSFRGCKLDSVNFRDAKLTDVTFEDCVLRDVDFAGARMARVKFPGCKFAGLDFTKAQCATVDLRGARLGTDTAAGIKAGYDALRGTIIDMPQLMTIAPLLAHQLGITVALAANGRSPHRRVTIKPARGRTRGAFSCPGPR